MFSMFYRVIESCRHVFSSDPNQSRQNEILDRGELALPVEQPGQADSPHENVEVILHVHHPELDDILSTAFSSVGQRTGGDNSEHLEGACDRH